MDTTYKPLVRELRNVDDLSIKALDYFMASKYISTSALQKYLNIGNVRATRIMDALEQHSLITPPLTKGGRRDILITSTQLNQLLELDVWYTEVVQGIKYEVTDEVTRLREQVKLLNIHNESLINTNESLKNKAMNLLEQNVRLEKQLKQIQEILNQN